MSDPSIAIAGNGDTYVAFSRESEESDPEDVLVYRSVDGLRTWSLWSVFADPAGLESLRNPKLAINARGTASEELVVAYEAGDTAVEVARVVLPTASPSWTSDRPIEVPGALGLEGADLAVGRDGTTVVGVAAVFDVNGTDFEWRYAVSLNAGLGFGNDLVLDTRATTELARAGIAVALGSEPSTQKAHVLMSFDVGSGTTAVLTVRHTSAPDWGVLGNFSATTTLPADTGGDFELDLAAQFDGDDLVAVIGGSDVLASPTAGGSWFEPTLEAITILRAGSVRWGAGGFALLGERNRGIAELRPSGLVTGTWTTVDVMAEPIIFGFRGFSAATCDPSRAGESVVVAGVDPVVAPQSIWINAPRRAAPGYGVNEDFSAQTVNAAFDSAPAVGDLDGDGDGEIVVTSLDPVFGTSSLHVFPVRAAAAPVRSRSIGPTHRASAPAIADVDGDGDGEIFVGAADGTVQAFDHLLTPLRGWPVALDAASAVGVSIGAVTGYARAEIVTSQSEGIDLFNTAGLRRAGWPWVPVGGEVVGRAAIGDVDADGNVEVVVASTVGITVLEADGTEQARFTGAFLPSAGPSLGDLDGDGDLEIAWPTRDGKVVVVQPDGTSISPGFPFDSGSGRAVSAVSFADLLAPGSPAIVFTTGGTAFAVDPSGNPAAGFPVVTGSGQLDAVVIGRIAEPATARPQLVTAAEHGFVHVITADGTRPRDWPHYYPSGEVLPPAVVDVDGDQISETVVASGGHLWILDSGVAPLGDARRRWPQSGHDARRSSCWSCPQVVPTSVDPEGSGDPVSIDLGAARPNPMGSTTRFSFTLDRSARVDLVVFDVRGRRVRSLSTEERPAGAHSIEWDGRDDAGRPVAAGTYFGSVVIADGAESRRLARRVTVVR